MNWINPNLYTLVNARSGAVANAHWAHATAAGTTWYGWCVHRVLGVTRAASFLEVPAAKVVLFLQEFLWAPPFVVIKVKQLGLEMMRAVDTGDRFPKVIWFIVAEYVFGAKMSRTGLEPARLAAQEPKS